MKNKILYSLAVVSLFTLLAFSSYTASPKIKDGIVFEKITWEEAIKKAKTDKKYIFVDVFARWCGPCKMLKRKTFKDKEVGDYYNKNFINIAIDGETEEGRYIINKYGIQGYPTLLIVDADGQLKTKQVGFVEPHILVNFGRRIVP